MLNLLSALSAVVLAGLALLAVVLWFARFLYPVRLDGPANDDDRYGDVPAIQRDPGERP